VTNTKCHIGTVFSPNDGHIVARKAVNILRKIVHQVGSITRLKDFVTDSTSDKFLIIIETSSGNSKC
jgi:enolase